MEEFSTSLIRDKIILMDDTPGGHDGIIKEPVVIRSNRIFLRLGSPPNIENVVIRAQNMHSTLRLASKVISSCSGDGSLLAVDTPFDWGAQWDAALSAYEKEHNSDIWAAAYVDGKPVFKTVKAPFIDVIEKCAVVSTDNYDATMEVTETVLKQIGHAVRISHSSNLATTFLDNGDSMRCGILHRGNKKSVIFSFTGTGGNRHGRIVRSVEVVAAYLEALNLRFIVRMLQERIRNGEISKEASERNRIEPAVFRQIALAKEIFSFEETYDVKYRPEKPDLFYNM